MTKIFTRDITNQAEAACGLTITTEIVFEGKDVDVYGYINGKQQFSVATIVDAEQRLHRLACERIERMAAERDIQVDVVQAAMSVAPSPVSYDFCSICEQELTEYHCEDCSDPICVECKAVENGAWFCADCLDGIFIGIVSDLSINIGSCDDDEFPSASSTLAHLRAQVDLFLTEEVDHRATGQTVSAACDVCGNSASPLVHGEYRSYCVSHAPVYASDRIGPMILSAEAMLNRLYPQAA